MTDKCAMKRFRDRHGLSQNQASRLLGASIATIRKMEQQRRENLGPLYMSAFAFAEKLLKEFSGDLDRATIEAIKARDRQERLIKP